MATTSRWRIEARKALSAVNRTLPDDATVDTVRQAYSAAYPFGERECHPYKIWLSEVRGYLEIRFPELVRERQRKELAREIERRGNSVAKMPDQLELL